MPYMSGIGHFVSVTINSIQTRLEDFLAMVRKNTGCLSILVQTLRESHRDDDPSRVRISQHQTSSRSRAGALDDKSLKNSHHGGRARPGRREPPRRFEVLRGSWSCAFTLLVKSYFRMSSVFMPSVRKSSARTQVLGFRAAGH